MKTKILTPDIFTTSFYVAHGSWEECSPWFKKNGFDVTQDCSIHPAVTLIRNPKNIIGLFINNELFDKQTKALKAGIIAHEACHLSWYMEEKLGDLFNMDAQEPQAYIIQYITTEVYKWLKI